MSDNLDAIKKMIEDASNTSSKPILILQGITVGLMTLKPVFMYYIQAKYKAPPPHEAVMRNIDDNVDEECDNDVESGNGNRKGNGNEGKMSTRNVVVDGNANTNNSKQQNKQQSGKQSKQQIKTFSIASNESTKGAKEVSTTPSQQREQPQTTNIPTKTFTVANDNKPFVDTTKVNSSINVPPPMKTTTSQQREQQREQQANSSKQAPVIKTFQIQSSNE